MVLILLVVSVASFLMWPVRYNHFLSWGTDLYEAHQPLYRDHDISGEIYIKEDTVGIGFILVDLKHSTQLPLVRLAVSDQDGRELMFSELKSCRIT